MGSFLIQLLLVCNVFMRVLTNEWGLLPKIFNVFDIAVVALLCLVALAGPDRSRALPRGILWRLVGFNAILFLGAIANLKWFHRNPACAQWLMWNQPLLLFLAVWYIRLPQEAIDRYIVLLKRLIIIQVMIGVLQIPNAFRYGDTEEIIGTFHGNATQYQGFLMLGLFMLVSLRGRSGFSKVAYRIAFVTVLLLVLAIDNKASWLGVAVALMAVAALTESSHAALVRHAKLVAVSAFILVVIVIGAQTLSPTAYKYTRVVEAWQSDNFRNIGKIKAVRDVLSSWKQNAQMALIGAGPATFYSRSGRQFYAWTGSVFQRDSRYLRGYKAIRRERSHSMEGVVAASDSPAFYFQFSQDDRNKVFAIGSDQTDEPFSSYTGLLGETGLLGTILYLGIYAIAGRRLLSAYRANRNNDRRQAFIACTIGFMVYTLINCIYNNWLETTRMTTILWTMIALSLRFETEQVNESTTHPEVEETSLDQVEAFPQSSAQRI